MKLYTYQHTASQYAKHIGKRFLLWLGAVAVVLFMVLAICHFAQAYLHWAPTHTVEFGIKLAIGAVGLVSWLLPSPLHHRHLRIPLVNSRQMAVLVVDDLRANGLIPTEELDEVIASVQNSIEDRMNTPKRTTPIINH